MDNRCKCEPSKVYNCRGKSGLRKATQRVTPFHRKMRNSGTERMSRALIFDLGTGRSKGAAGVKTAKLCVEQDQIGKLYSARGCFRVRSLEGVGNNTPREMVIKVGRILGSPTD